MSFIKWSPFLIKKEYKGKIFIFNAVNKKIFSLNKNWVKKINQMKKTDFLVVKDKIKKISLFTQSENYIENLINWLNYKKNKTKKILHLCINITTKCFLKCPYCFQNHIQRKNLNDSVLNSTISFIRNFINKHKIKRIFIYLFGGEPLLNTEKCFNFLKKINYFFYESDVRYFFLVVTTGIIDDLKLYKKLRQNGVEYIQISFDGSKKSHEITRQGTYFRILKNFKYFLDIFSHVLIKYNLHKQNWFEFEEFLKDILSLSPDRTKYRIILEALHTTLTYSDNAYLFNLRDNLLVDALLHCIWICKKYNVKYSVINFFEPPCMFTGINGVMIDTDGSISKCNTAYQMRSFTVGNVNEEFNTLISKLKKHEEEIERKILEVAESYCTKWKCPFFPICETGCFYLKFISGKKFNEPLCKRDFYLRFINGLLDIEANCSYENQIS